jgi:beta-propeller repeat-containing protein
MTIKTLIMLTVSTLMVTLACALAAPFFEVRALAVNSAFARSAMLQTQHPLPLRRLVGLEEIRVWLGPNTVDYTFEPNQLAMTERRATLDFSSFDMRPPALEGRAQVYDLFYSDAEGTRDIDGGYLTIEAVSNSQAEGAGGGNVAEVGLRFSGHTTFDYGKVVSSSVTLGSNADPGSIIRAIDGNTQTYAILGNTVGQSRRLRITIGFTPSGIDCPGCTFLNISNFITYDIFSPISVQLSAYDSSCDKAPGVVLEVVVTNDSGEGDFRRTVTTDSNGVAQFGYSRGKISLDQITVTGTTQEGGHFQCVRIVEWVQNETCPMENSVQGMPHASATLTGARELRDNALGRTPRGQTYTRLYYRFSSEAVQIMTLNPMLVLRSRAIIERYKPAIQSMARGEQVTLTRGDLDEIDDFLNGFAAKGSSQLQQAVKEVCEDLKSPNVQNEFHLTVIEGPNSEMPGHHLPRTISRAGGMTSLLGFCLAFVLCIARGRKPDLKAKAIGSLCAVLAVLLIGGQCPVAHAQSRVTAVPGPLVGIDKAARSRLGKLPLAFEANHGQVHSEAKFLSRENNYSLLLKPTEAAIQFRIADTGLRNECASFVQRSERLKSEVIGCNTTTTNPQAAIRNPESRELRMMLIGADPSARMAGLDEMRGKSNYFIGKDSTRWRPDVPTYARVRSDQVYPGIDLIYYGNQHELEYDFVVAPGGDPRVIKLQFDGADKMETDGQGDLVLHVAGGQFRQRKPGVYQDVNGIKRIIPCRYVVIQNPKSKIQNQLVGFELGAYDTTKPLIIDPVLAYSTYLGGNGDDEGNSITVDSSGNLYVVGFTDSVNFPTSSASQPSFGGGRQDVFVAKLNPSGNQLIYSTYLGGDGQDNGSGIAVDSAGNAYITGFTGSANFPVRNALQPAKNGQFNAFVAKLDPTGSLLYSTHLGGSLGDYGSCITVDSLGSVYVAGVATSANFPMANALQSTPGGSADVYLAKLDPLGSQLVYSTYLGGAGNDGATSIAVDSVGSVYLTGVTTSRDFRTASPLQASHGGGLFDAFVARVNPSGGRLVYATYLGGGGEDRAFRISVDSAGNAYVTGDTDSTNFPTANALQGSIGGSVDAFLAKINAAGSALVYSTYLGGSGIDGGTAIAVDSAGSAYVAGFTGSANFPTTNAIQQANGGGSFDAFVAKLGPSGAALEWSTYLGGSGIDAGFGIAVDSSGVAYVMGQTESNNFPTSAPLQPVNGGGTSDLFIAKLVPIGVTGVHIAGASVSGKKLLVFGSGFDSGAKILLSGESQKTINDEQSPTTALIAKKAGKMIAPGQTVTLQVRNSDGTLSNQFSFTK